MTDDDVLAAYDLSAWQAPPPPAGLADAVVRRMAAPARPARRVWIVAASVVAAAAAVVVALLVFDHSEPATSARLEREQAATSPATIPPAPAGPSPQHTAPRSMAADIAAVQQVMRRIKPALIACNDGSFSGTLTLDLHIGKTGKLDTLVYDRKVAFGRCIEITLDAAKFDVRSGTTLVLRFPIAFPKPARPPAKTTARPCDASELEVKATEAFSRGLYPAALTGFERALACKWTQPVVAKAMLAACHVKNEGKARQFWPKLSPTQQPMLLQRCLARGIDPREL